MRNIITTATTARIFAILRQDAAIVTAADKRCHLRSCHLKSASPSEAASPSKRVATALSGGLRGLACSLRAAAAGLMRPGYCRPNTGAMQWLLTQWLRRPAVARAVRTTVVR